MKTRREILAYLDNKMTDDEKNSFEAALKQNQELASELILFAEVNEAIREDEVELLRQKLGKLLKSEKKIRTSSHSNLYKLLKYSAAALIVLAIGLSLWFSRQKMSTQELYDEYYQRYSTRFLTRSLDSSDSRINKLRAFYLQAYYPQAHHAALEWLEENPKDSETHFYLGLTALEMKQYELAIRELKIAESGISALKLADVRWYLAMAYLKKDNSDQAKEYLKIIKQTENRYTSRAKSILKKLD